MKICLLLSTFAYDGIKRSVVHYANEMHNQGHEVWVGVLHDWPGKVSLRSELKIPEKQIISWDGLGQGRRELAIHSFFRRQRFDVVHANTIKMNHLGRWLAILARVPCVVASEDNLCLNRSWKTRTEDRVLASCGDAVVMISNAVAESFLQIEKLPREKVHVVYYGLPVETFQSMVKPPNVLEAKRKELSLSHDPIITCAARLHHSKSLQTYLQAARQVVDQKPNIQFVLAGDGDERSKLEKLRDELKLQKNFHFVGAREDIYDIFQLSDIVTLCSLWEGLGFSLMEGMALGKPLVGTDVTGINEIIVHDRNGLLVPPQKPDQLAKAYLKILEDPAFAQRLKSGCAEVIVERFDIKKNTRQLLQLYENILKGKRS
jgi:L-malate glycosyltransferase